MNYANKIIGFHIHTCYSFDSLQKPERVVDYYASHGYGIIIITDHNEIEGARIAKEYAQKRYGDKIEVIIGEEIVTDIGDIIAFPIINKIEKGNIQIVFKQIKEQNAFACLAHPFSQHDLVRINNDEVITNIDFVEVFNCRLCNPQLNKYAAEYAKKHNKLEIIGIDAHLKYELGNASFVWDEKYSIIRSKTKISNQRYIRLSSIIKAVKMKNYGRIPALIILIILGK